MTTNVNPRTRAWFRLAALYFAAGVTLGSVMGASGDHSLMAVHAHLNLLGWVSLFLFGIYYRLNPALDTSRAALMQVSIWCVGTIVMAIGVGLVHTGHEAGDPLAAVGSLIILAGMLIFGWIVYKQERAPAKQQQMMAPAE